MDRALAIVMFTVSVWAIAAGMHAIYTLSTIDWTRVMGGL